MTDRHRLSKKELRQDKFLQGVYNAWAYAQDHIPIVIAGVVAFVVLIVVAFQVGGSATGKVRGGNPSAERALSSARSLFAVGQQPAAIDALQDLRAQYGNTDAGREGTYLLGNALYESGDYAGALAVFEEFLAKPLHDELMADGARLAIAACREQTGDLAGALADYETLWTSGASPGSRIQGAMGAARCARNQGRNDRAQEFYQQVVDAFPDSPEAEDARFRILELKG